MDRALSRSIYRAFVPLFVAAALILASSSRADAQGWKARDPSSAVQLSGVPETIRRDCARRFLAVWRPSGPRVVDPRSNES